MDFSTVVSMHNDNNPRALARTKLKGGARRAQRHAMTL